MRNRIMAASAAALLAGPLYAMGKQPDKNYSAVPAPASQTPAYNNPYASGTSGTRETSPPEGNSNTLPRQVESGYPTYQPYGTQPPPGATPAVVGTPGSPGTSGAPATSGGPAVGSVEK